MLSTRGWIKQSRYFSCWKQRTKTQCLVHNCPRIAQRCTKWQIPQCLDSSWNNNEKKYVEKFEMFCSFFFLRNRLLRMCFEVSMQLVSHFCSDEAKQSFPSQLSSQSSGQEVQDFRVEHQPLAESKFFTLNTRGKQILCRDGEKLRTSDSPNSDFQVTPLPQLESSCFLCGGRAQFWVAPCQKRNDFSKKTWTQSVIFRTPGVPVRHPASFAADSVLHRIRGLRQTCDVALPGQPSLWPWKSQCSSCDLLT